MKMNEKQQEALDLIKAGHNVFLSGPGGAGKSTIIDALREEMREDMVFLAPTGIAALNIKGSTIHRFFSLAPQLYDIHEKINISSKVRKLLRSVKSIFIDEISMVRSDIIIHIDRQLQAARQSSEIFGGCQIIVSGDFHQLPPIVATAEEREYFEFNGMSPYACYTSSWQEANFKAVEFSEIFRQKSDPDFIKILDVIRDKDLAMPIEVDGKITNCIDALNESCLISETPPKNKLSICMNKKVVDFVNFTQLQSIPSKEFTFEAWQEGYFPPRNYPTEPFLKVKVGARVMLLNNQPANSRFHYVNGSMGEIVGVNFEKQIITVKLDDGRVGQVDPFLWEELAYRLKKCDKTGRLKVRPQVIGSFKQFPIKAAYAITVHKSQSLTLDNGHINFGNGTFCPGQAYVAISRMKSREGLSLSRPIMEKDILRNDEVFGFYEAISPYFPQE